jgi:hypothetical protein
LIPAHDIIDNWTWERFKRELRSRHLHKEPDRAAIRKDFEEFKCLPYPSTYDGLPPHIHRLACIVPGANTAADPHDPTRRRNYADTKSDLIRLLRSPYGKYEIEQIYNTQNKKSTITGGAAARTTVQNAPNTTQHIGSIGQYRLTISPRSTGQINTLSLNSTRLDKGSRLSCSFTTRNHISNVCQLTKF